MSLLLLLQNGAEPKPTIPNRTRVVERPPMRQYLVATSPNGAVERWGEDELDAADVLEDLTDSDTAPGGHKDLTAALPRKPGVDYSDMRMGTKLEVFGAGRYKVSEYRLERAPRTSGDYLVMDPAASGYQVLLSDREEAREVFIDAELGAFGEVSGARKAARPTEKINTEGSARVLPAGTVGGFPAVLAHAWAALETVPASSQSVVESWYDASGIELGVFWVKFSPTNMVPGWETAAYESASNVGPGVGGELHNFAGVEGTGAFAVGPGNTYVLLRTAYPFEFHGEGPFEGEWITRIFGRHGLLARGVFPEVGLLASDIIAYALSRWAPGLQFTTGAFGSLKATNFAIPHLVFKEPTTVQEIITQALRFELLEWGVWPGQFGPTFYLNERGQREGAKRWRARIRPAKLTETGQQMDQLYNRVIMSWRDPDGTTRTMGPIGSGYPYIDSRCEDLDPESPLNEAGVIRTKHLTMDGLGTASGAAEQSRLFLEKCRLLNSSGEATLTGYVEDEHGIEWPYYCVHACDQIEFLDSSIKGYRYIIEATRSRKSRSVNIKLDAPPDSYEAILAELQVRESVAGFGS